MCLKQRMGNAEQNSPQDVWDAFRGALNTRNDRDAIFSIMRLKVFGSSRDEETRQRRAKVATAVLRFLKPNDWGVVDWRTVAMLGLLKKTNGNVDQALVLAKKKLAAELRELLDISCSTLLMNSRHVRRTRNTGPCEQGLLKGLLTLKWQYSGSH